MEENNQQNEKATYRMGENNCKSYLWQGVNTYTKNFYNYKAQITWFKKWADLNRHFSKEDIHTNGQ